MPGYARAKNAAKEGAPFHSSLNVNGKISSGQMPRVALLDVTEDSTPPCALPKDCNTNSTPKTGWSMFLASRCLPCVLLLRWLRFRGTSGVVLAVVSTRLPVYRCLGLLGFGRSSKASCGLQQAGFAYLFHVHHFSLQPRESAHAFQSGTTPELTKYCVYVCACRVRPCCYLRHSSRADREQRLCTASRRGVGVGKGAILLESMAVTL